MRILFVTTQLGRGYVHGTERYLGSLAEVLRARGHEVVFLAGDPEATGAAAPFGSEIDRAQSIHAYPTHGWTSVHGHSPAAVERWIRALGPDVVHVASLAQVGCGAVLAAAALEIPLVATAMDFWWICPRATLMKHGSEICDASPGWRECLRCVTAGHPRPGVAPVARMASRVAPLGLAMLALSSLHRGGSPREAGRWSRRRQILSDCLARIDEVIFPSPATRDLIAPQLGHARHSDIPYGLAAPWFEAPRPALAGPRSPKALVFGFAGSLQPHKGPHLLLEALQRLGWTRTRVRIAGTHGEPVYHDALTRAAQGLCVEFVDGLRPDQVGRFLRTLDVFVLPSCWPENLPFALLEAQAAGLPVIASDVAGISQRIPDSRMLFEVGSAEDLARAMSGFVGGQYGAQVPGVDTVEQMVDKTLAVYRRAVERHTLAGRR